MKRNFDFPEKFDITLTCASGVEKVLKSELKRLGLPEAPVINGTCTFSGGMQDVANLNVNLRTADRVYIKLAEFSAESFDELFDGVVSVEFERFIPGDAKITINGKCVKSKLFAVSACQSIIKKAIVKRLSEKFGLYSLPETGAFYEICFSIFKDVVTILLNTSGVGLHKRGYRDLVGIAPIKETLASALILLSDYYYERPFADPFCGSGTLAIEATRIALNIAGGINRRFAFNEWKNFDPLYYSRAFEQAKDNEKRDRKIEVLGSDIDGKAVLLATRHAEKAGVLKHIKFTRRDVSDFYSPSSFGTIVSNPPYGERVYDKKQAEICYKSLGEAYSKLDRWSLFVITSAKNFEKSFGKRADRERKLYNSNKECKFYYYYNNQEK